MDAPRIQVRKAWLHHNITAGLPGTPHTVYMAHGRLVVEHL